MGSGFSCDSSGCPPQVWCCPPSTQTALCISAGTTSGPRIEQLFEISGAGDWTVLPSCREPSMQADAGLCGCFPLYFVDPRGSGGQWQSLGLKNCSPKVSVLPRPPGTVERRSQAVGQAEGGVQYFTTTGLLKGSAGPATGTVYQSEHHRRTYNLGSFCPSAKITRPPVPAPLLVPKSLC